MVWKVFSELYRYRSVTSTYTWQDLLATAVSPCDSRAFRPPHYARGAGQANKCWSALQSDSILELRRAAIGEEEGIFEIIFALLFLGEATVSLLLYPCLLVLMFTHGKTSEEYRYRGDLIFTTI
jgi:hypothetical protein